ncbi:unnamed protein product [Calypogeia fissa]
MLGRGVAAASCTGRALLDNPSIVALLNAFQLQLDVFRRLVRKIGSLNSVHLCLIHMSGSVFQPRTKPDQEK